MPKHFRIHIPWIVWLAVIIVLCLTPGNKLPRIEWQLISIGTFAHFSLYFVLTFLMLMAFLRGHGSSEKKKLNQSNLRLYLRMVLVGTAIGFAIELIQGNFIYQRYYDLEDILVNGIGTVFGGLGYSLIGRKIV